MTLPSGFLPQTITVHQNIVTGFDYVGSMTTFVMTALSDGTVATVGEEKGKNKLKRFSLETGRELCSTNVKHVYGITEMNLRDRSTIVVSH